ISIKEKALQMNEDQMKLAKLKKSSGFTSSADVIEFELRAATLEADLKRLNLETEEKSRELSLLLGRSEPTTKLAVKGHLMRGTVDKTTTAILKEVQDANPEIIEARLQRDISIQDRTIAKSSFLPRVDLEGRYGKLADDT
ncbi:TolC family protein, partial [Vibrio parahaemolyticus]